ncbi:MAG: lysostaphin resistance A-like protein [Enterococcus sp.]
MGNKTPSQQVGFWESCLKPLLVVLFICFIWMMVANIFFQIIVGYLAYGRVANPEGVMNTVSLLLTWITSLLVTIWAAKKFSKFTLKDLGFSKEKVAKRYLTGLLTGIALMVTVFLINVVFGFIEPALNPDVNWLMILAMFIFFLIQGLTEEVVVRGYLFSSLQKKYSVPLSIVVSSLVFAFIHINNPGMTWLSALNLFLAGAMFAVVYQVTGSILLVGGIHSMWNFVMGPILGVEVSGTVSESFLTEHLTDRVFFNGGSFGFEGGIIVTLVLVVFTAILWPKMKPAKI